MRSRNSVGLEAAQEVLHARALELEDAVRVPGLEDVEGRRVVEGQGVDVDDLGSSPCG